MKKIKIGLLGFGTVGSGVYQTLTMNHDAIVQKTGVELEVARVLVKSVAEPRKVEAPDSLFTESVDAILEDPEIAIIIEVLGGIEPASSWALRAMKAGKHFVTANKAMVAHSYKELVEASADNHVMLRFEASVGGGIPVLDALQAPLTSNDIEEISGIVNGTTNYILTQMEVAGLGFDVALKKAQELGFAEADPTADVDGIDAANKLSILMALGFGEVVGIDKIPTVGIRGVSALDVDVAGELGYKIKLLAAAKKSGRNLQGSVQPTLVASQHLLAAVANEFNAVFIHGNAVDDLMFYGRGAGSLPTASAVVGDVIEIANAIDKDVAYDSYVNRVPEAGLTYVGEGVNKYYLRLEAKNEPGVLGQITTTFGAHGLLIDSVLQRETSADTASIVFVVDLVAREKLDSALSDLTGVRCQAIMRVM
ncbi:MAG: homoserine dehydrogenase [Streptococcaceae bacterium]|jgi:homoserine dehydrogenase|nr:homoserine dehydrogenase [Streptococcaceae bacterium]